MKLPSRHAAIPMALVILLAIILVVLATLQIRWTGRVSQADRERMQTNLQTEVMRFRRDFHLQLLRMCWAFQSPEDGLNARALRFYAGRYDDWMSASARPDIIAGLYVWGRAGSRLQRLDSALGRFKPAAWPTEFQGLRRRLEQSGSMALNNEPLESMQQRWVLDEESDTLVHSFGGATVEGNDGKGGSGARGAVIIELNMGFVWHTLLPELVGRYFRGPGASDYHVSVIGGSNPPKIYYRSAPSSAGGTELTGDIVENLVRTGGGSVSERPAARELANEKRWDTPSADSAAQPRTDFLPLMTVAGNGGAWRLVVRHSSGSVEAAVLNLRHRDLAVSLGVLLLLAISMALIVVSAQRAQRLARLQMGFMAGVSHELRTPLAVICSAAENLADRVVSAPEQVQNYGALIRDEGRRLSDMVGQVLTFTAGQAGQRAYALRPLDVTLLVDETLAAIWPTLESAHAMIEKHLEPDLPPVLGDPSALVRCVQNLISNAVKYGGESRWVGIRTHKVRDSAGDEVQISVEDRGSGIDAEDLPHIFEPFYRGHSSKNGDGSQIHGTGLGLSIAKDIAEAMGGKLSVMSERGNGCRFTLHLPALNVAGPAPQR